MNLDDMINDALNNPTPAGRSLEDLMREDIGEVSQDLIQQMVRHCSLSALQGLADDGIDPFAMLTGMARVLLFINQHGVPTDLREIIERGN